MAYLNKSYLNITAFPIYALLSYDIYAYFYYPILSVFQRLLTLSLSLTSSLYIYHHIYMFYYIFIRFFTTCQSYSTNPMHVTIHVSPDGSKFKLWDSFCATSQAEGDQMFCCAPISSAIYPYVAFEVTKTFGGMQTYMNRIFMYSEEISNPSPQPPFQKQAIVNMDASADSFPYMLESLNYGAVTSGVATVLGNPELLRDEPEDSLFEDSDYNSDDSLKHEAVVSNEVKSSTLNVPIQSPIHSNNTMPESALLLLVGDLEYKIKHLLTEFKVSSLAASHPKRSSSVEPTPSSPALSCDHEAKDTKLIDKVATYNIREVDPIHTSINLSSKKGDGAQDNKKTPIGLEDAVANVQKIVNKVLESMKDKRLTGIGKTIPEMRSISHIPPQIHTLGIGSTGSYQSFSAGIGERLLVMDRELPSFSFPPSDSMQFTGRSERRTAAVYCSSSRSPCRKPRKSSEVPMSREAVFHPWIPTAPWVPAKVVKHPK